VPPASAITRRPRRSLSGASRPPPLTLPAGAVVTTTYAGHPAVAWTAAHPLAGGVVVREAHVLVPAPELPAAVLISLATPVLQDWDVYRRVMHDVCTSLRFDPARPHDEAQVLLLRLRVREPTTGQPVA
jgi:hypothetical protein